MLIWLYWLWRVDWLCLAWKSHLSISILYVSMSLCVSVIVNGYLIEGWLLFYRVVHWKATAGLLLSYPTIYNITSIILIYNNINKINIRYFKGDENDAGRTILSTLPQFLNHNFMIRTSDNVGVDIYLRISYQIKEINIFWNNPIQFVSYIQNYVCICEYLVLCCVWCLGWYCSILLLSCFISSGALEGPDLLLSNSATKIPNTRHHHILIITMHLCIYYDLFS